MRHLFWILRKRVNFWFYFRIHTYIPVGKLFFNMPKLEENNEFANF